MKFIYYSVILILLLFSQASASGQDFKVTPVAIGKQLVRTSLPLPRGFLTEKKALEVTAEKKLPAVGFRPISWYPVKPGEPKSVRRAMVTFPFNFTDLKPVTFHLTNTDLKKQSLSKLPVSISVIKDDIRVSWKNGATIHLKLLAPECKSYKAQPMEIVETNEFYLWQRFHIPDPQWPRIIETRLDATGGVTIIAHVQRVAEKDGFAPELGWEMQTDEKVAHGQLGSSKVELKDQLVSHSFKNGTEALWVLGEDALAIYHPAAPLKRRGKIDVSRTKDGKLLYRYLRCTAEEQVPMQPFSWQRIEIVLAPPRLASLRPTLESPHVAEVSTKLWDELYGIDTDLPAALPPDLTRLVKYQNDAIIASSCVGDDWGNVTHFTDSTMHGSVYGTNRLDHCTPIFLNGWHNGDQRLIETALLWCNNFHDQSIWWGEPERGGTRYMNNIRMKGITPLTREYMWRSNSSISFCTKGFDAFWLAWEQTGDPCMKESLEAQIAYTMEHVHAVKDNSRNIGVVRDFVCMYRYTGEKIYLDQALRLFRELRTTSLSTGDLFDQHGNPLNPNPPFIEVDRYDIGYAKPYIIGYALKGLPDLLVYAPDEPKLREVVQAVANFLVDSQDPLGGWRYPHPNSSNVWMWLAMESTWQIMQASRILGPNEKLLNAIEATLRQRLHGWLHFGKLYNELSGWEVSTGKVKSHLELLGLYKKPTDRDAGRDYTDGIASVGSTELEGLLYFQEVLAYYLKYRPASRLLEAPKPEEPLGKVLQRVPLIIKNKNDD